jgi:outer membrane protein TolC
VRLARENLAASKAVEPVIELSLITARHALDVLLGRRPGSSEDLPETLADLPNLEPVPIGLPASLLDRRPDVKAAESALWAANEKIGVSIAQLYPDLTLTASVGRSADRWRDIWRSQTETYFALLGLAQPIFKGGQLRAQVDAAEARYAELAANYAGTVLTAMQEAEDALVGEQMLQTQLGHAEIRFREAESAESLSRQRYQRGVEGILAVLESQRRRRAAEEELTVLKGQIWTTRVNLFLALGGDWDYQEPSEEQVALGK